MRDRRQHLAPELLGWYDNHARAMPWRVSPSDRLVGVVPDPYQVWMSEIMLQQTTVVTVRNYFLKFIARWPTVFDLAAAKDEDVMAAWAGLGYYARARNLLKCARVVADELGGKFPVDEPDLQKLPGIGPYTSAAIASIAFDRSATVLDGNVERVMARMFSVLEPLPASKEQLRGLAKSMLPKSRFGDYSQAVMDLGATVCTPRNPSCGVCPWTKDCVGRKQGIADTLPNKTPKAKKPTRLGICFIAQGKNKDVLLERRPDKGLLGGMLGWLGSEWAEDEPEFAPPFDANWEKLSSEVRHTFTHFHLRLQVYVCAPLDKLPQNIGVVIADFDDADLPTVMRKAWQLAHKA